MSIKSFDTLSYKGVYAFNVVDNLSNLLTILNDEKHSAIFIDSNISLNYKEFISGLKGKKIEVPVSSETKSIQKLIYFLEIFSNLSFKRNSSIVVIGGATMQDIFATACCLYFRGINWIFVPTTLLAQGDSCIGSKTSLDGFGKKNQFGVFYPPSKIYICSEYLKTLPMKEIYSGIGDILHYILPYDQDNIILKKIIDLSKKPSKEALIKYCIQISSMAMRIKSELVKIDEFDLGPRKIFNFGHTFGHVIEKSSKDYIPHGIAVLCGLFIALNFKKEKSIILNCKYQKELIKELLEIIFLQEKSQLLIDYSKFKNLLNADKKNTSQGRVNLILPTSVFKSKWNFESFTSLYGLNSFDLDIDECVTSFNALPDVRGIKFL